MSCINVLPKVNGYLSEKVVGLPILSGVYVVSLAEQRVQVYLQKYSLFSQDWVALSIVDITKNSWFNMALMVRTPAHEDLQSGFAIWSEGCPF